MIDSHGRCEEQQQQQQQQPAGYALVLYFRLSRLDLPKYPLRREKRTTRECFSLKERYVTL